MKLSWLQTPFGPLTLVAEGDGLAGVYLPDHSGAPALDGPEDAGDPVLQAAAAQLAEYFAGTRHAFDLPLAPRGTEFQRAVWSALAEIPYGVTTSYGALAREVGRPRAVRAVGAANGKNPISIILPCHRVVGSDGTLTGYAGGLPLKRWLLDHEARHAAFTLTA